MKTNVKFELFRRFRAIRNAFGKEIKFKRIRDENIWMTVGSKLFISIKESEKLAFLSKLRTNQDGVKKAREGPKNKGVLL